MLGLGKKGGGGLGIIRELKLSSRKGENKGIEIIEEDELEIKGEEVMLKGKEMKKF